MPSIGSSLSSRTHLDIKCILCKFRIQTEYLQKFIGSILAEFIKKGKSAFFMIYIKSS